MSIKTMFEVPPGTGIEYMQTVKEHVLELLLIMIELLLIMIAENADNQISFY